MEAIKTNLLESETDNFLVNLNKYAGNDKISVSIKQIKLISRSQKIIIPSSILSNLIELLIQYNTEINGDSVPAVSSVNKRLPKRTVKEIIDRYLNKAVNISDLSLQFNLSPEGIERVLINHGLPIVSNNVNDYNNSINIEESQILNNSIDNCKNALKKKKSPKEEITTEKRKKPILRWGYGKIS